MTTDDPFDLKRFADAQAHVFADVLAELAAGSKTTHWMWFVFPQLAALGRSSTAKYYGLSSLFEAQAYWRDPILGARLRQCCDLLLDAKNSTARQIFGSTDEMKLRSCMTLFESAVPIEPVFGSVLEKYFAGQRDRMTADLLRHTSKRNR